ncbi:uncharacterized protein Z518_03638 [Rhinocladiella mackenziei CBS 650.93]|uniref:Heterokaryon incompatibility domain-containing protein n=1 Tax=Rhinocladiella mackenziei CBS 650.93 TaxID=1442369 RepID=A0A0D2IR73_9EURO|nr:uncharacterized protein Z518_03638 [Rhinocladiella mackenziei CBS 650.93]KIX05666.1 hypothetical protein Z518_03638 [Rhinocladiella mackenziei CBS 650.93]
MLIIGDDGNMGHAHLGAPGTDLQTLVGRGPVAQRAWCPQERQLAPPVLHIGQAEVFLECVRCRRYESESIPGQEFDPKHDGNYLFVPDMNSHGEFGGKPTSHVRNVLSWYVVVQDYTGRSLFDTGDKLIAIAGLAKRVQPVVGGDYLAGIWRSNIHVGLTWMIEETASAMRAPVSPYRAPSWSWASMDGPVRWKDLDHDIVSKGESLKSAMDIMDTTVSLAGTDPFGAVVYAELVVSGQLRSTLSDMLLHNEVLDYSTWERTGLYYPPSVGGWYMEDEKRPWQDEERICLKIMTRAVYGLSQELVHDILILERVQSMNDDDEADGDGLETYRRIGYGEIMVADYFVDCPARTVRG